MSPAWQQASASAHSWSRIAANFGMSIFVHRTGEERRDARNLAAAHRIQLAHFDDPHAGHLHG
jgi:hypothetical protein